MFVGKQALLYNVSQSKSIGEHRLRSFVVQRLMNLNSKSTDPFQFQDETTQSFGVRLQQGVNSAHKWFKLQASFRKTFVEMFWLIIG